VNVGLKHTHMLLSCQIIASCKVCASVVFDFYQQSCWGIIFVKLLWWSVGFSLGTGSKIGINKKQSLIRPNERGRQRVCVIGIYLSLSPFHSFPFCSRGIVRFPCFPGCVTTLGTAIETKHVETPHANASVHAYNDLGNKSKPSPY